MRLFMFTIAFPGDVIIWRGFFAIAQISGVMRTKCVDRKTHFLTVIVDRPPQTRLELRVLTISVLSLNCSKWGIFSPRFRIFTRKSLDQKKLFDGQKCKEGIATYLPVYHDVTQTFFLFHCFRFFEAWLRLIPHVGLHSTSDFTYVVSTSSRAVGCVDGGLPADVA